jgi:hypothetical protein
MIMNSGNALSTSLAHGHHDLIGSDRVESTNVYRSDGRKIGEIERVMIDKISGQVAYAVIGFGGFLGMGEDHYRSRGSDSPTTRSSAAARSISPTRSSRTRRITPPARNGNGIRRAAAISTTITASRPTGR